MYSPLTLPDCIEETSTATLADMSKNLRELTEVVDYISENCNKHYVDQKTMEKKLKFLEHQIAFLEMYNKSVEERIDKLEYKKNEEKIKIIELEKKDNEDVANIIVQVQAQALTLDEKQIERFEMVVSERPNSDKLRPMFIDKNKSCPRQVNLKL